MSPYADPATRSTALHEAVLGGHAHCAFLLLSLGADASARDRAGNTPLHACAASSAADVAASLHLAEALLAQREEGCVAAMNGAGATPLHLAASRGKRALVRLLVENGEWGGGGRGGWGRVERGAGRVVALGGKEVGIGEGERVGASGRFGSGPCDGA